MLTLTLLYQQSEQGKSDLMEQVAKLEAERSVLEKTCAELKQKTEQLERRAAELRAAEEKRHQEELLALKKTNAQLKVTFENTRPCKLFSLITTSLFLPITT